MLVLVLVLVLVPVSVTQLAAVPLKALARAVERGCHWA